MTSMFVTCMRQGQALARWRTAWAMREEDFWRNFTDSIHQVAQSCDVDLLRIQNGLGIGTDVELSARLTLDGKASGLRQMAHLLARDHHQYAVRTVAEGGAQWSLTAPVANMAEGVERLARLQIPGSVFEESLEINVLTEQQADDVLLQLPMARLRAVSIERVSGLRSVDEPGAPILLRPL